MSAILGGIFGRKPPFRHSRKNTYQFDLLSFFSFAGLPASNSTGVAPLAIGHLHLGPVPAESLGLTP